MSNCHPLEVVGRGSETQLQVGENLNKITEREKGVSVIYSRFCPSFLLFKLKWKISINPLTAKLFNMNFHPLEVVSRWREPQLQVSENYSDLTKWKSTVFKYCW